MDFSMDELSARVNKSKQSLYKLIKQNKEFINLHSRVKDRVKYYDDAVLEWLCHYYEISVEDALGKRKLEDTEAENPQTQPPGTAEIEALRAEIEELKAKIEQLESEKQELLNQNQQLFIQQGQLLLLLGQEKAEKQALLPPPRKPIIERVKGLFKKGN